MHDEAMASASNAVRIIQLRHEARSETILIFDTEIDADFAQNVKAKACFAFKVNIETVGNVSFRRSLTVGTETLWVTLLPEDIPRAYDIAKEQSGSLPFVFELDVKFGVPLQRSGPIGLPVASASIGASQLPEAGREGSNTVQAHTCLTKLVQGTLQNRLAADGHGVYYVVSDGTKSQHSDKHGAAQGEQTQDKGQWDACIDAIMATNVYREGQIGRK